MAASDGTVLSTTKSSAQSKKRERENDVLVLWQNGTRNVVSSTDLSYRSPLKRKKLVKMKWGATWWRGHVIDFEEVDSTSLDESSDDEPLSSLCHRKALSVTDALSSDGNSDVPRSRVQSKAEYSKPDTASSDENSDVPLSRFQSKVAKSKPDDVPLSSCQSEASKFMTDETQENVSSSETAITPSLIDPEIPTNDTHTDDQLNPLISTEDVSVSKPEICSNFTCKDEIFAACSLCQSLLCFEHFVGDLDCESHNHFSYAYKITEDSEKSDPPNQSPLLSKGGNLFDLLTSSLEEDPWTNGDDLEHSSANPGHCQLEDDVGSLKGNNHEVSEIALCPMEIGLDLSDHDSTQTPTQSQPEDFVVEGEPRILNATEKVIKRLSRNKIVKENRNSGLGYFTEKGNKYIPGRKSKSFVSCSKYCQPRGLLCHEFSDIVRHDIRTGFYGHDLQKQREWIARYTTVKTPRQSTRKTKHVKYYLPLGKDNEKKQVCQKMFLNTLGISERQVRTVVKKMCLGGMLEREKRGGRQKQTHDQKLRDDVRRHIERFPKMESHYCRANTNYQYLSRDLNASKMYELYASDQTASMKASESFYRKILKDMKLKFHVPKKDLCGICETFNRGSLEEKERITSLYDKHIDEKLKVREIKGQLKTGAIDSNGTYEAVVFDLQQVIYLPKSERGEIFYKRRLSCYNFTVFELATKRGTCYTHHEGQARRGSNEIASNLFAHLNKFDNEGKQEIALFCDGCPGQNKNTIIPAMLYYFVSNSKSIQRVTLHFFATNHGQSEGDSMHSVIERCLKGVGDVFLPSQLSALMGLARRHPEPYKVVEVQTSDVLDWKEFSRKLHILRVRSTVEGKHCDWTKVMQMQVDKKIKGKILIKMSHLDTEWGTVDFQKISRHSHESMKKPKKAYIGGPPKLSSGKFEDLMSLCTGPTPVVYHPDHVAFFKNLPHQVTGAKSN